MHTGYSSTPTIELTWALILTSARHLVDENAALRAGGWQRCVGDDMARRTALLAGGGEGPTSRHLHGAWLCGREGARARALRPGLRATPSTTARIRTLSNQPDRGSATGSLPSIRSRRLMRVPSWSATARWSRTAPRGTSRRRAATSRTSFAWKTKHEPLRSSTIGCSSFIPTGSIRGRFGAAPTPQKPHAGTHISDPAACPSMRARQVP
jgi:hypothetical protein